MKMNPVCHRLGGWSALVALLVLLAGCGGGSGGGPAVSNMSASNARFGGTAIITVSGSGLDEGISLTIDGPCQTLTTVVGGSADTRQFTCDVTAVGKFTATVTKSNGAMLGRLSVDVPKPRVEVSTRLGNFLLELDPDKAPVTVRNFLTYVNANFYNGVLVHEAIPNRGILAGGFNSGLRAKAPTAPAIALESANGLKNLKGSVGMFRTELPNSARAQWYINTVDNPDLDRVDDTNPGYAVFGAVVNGMPVVEAITAVPTRPDLVNSLSNTPVTEVVITDATQTR